MSADQTRKPFYTLSLLLTAAGVILTALLWLNNLYSAWHYHARLFSGIGNTDIMPSGFFPQLDWSTVDVSTITTFIPFFGFCLLFQAVRRVRVGKNQLFFPGYDRLNIALGLLGTLWGIILIGYYPVDQVTIPALMSCLHTAMFSTLAAIIWVMVLEPLLLRPWINALYRAEVKESQEEQPVDKLLHDLIDGLTTAGETLKESGKAAGIFREELEKLNQALAENRKNEAVWQEHTMDCLRSLTAAAEEFKTHQEQISAENKELRTRMEQQELALSAAMTEAAKLKRQLDAIREALR